MQTAIKAVLTAIGTAAGLISLGAAAYMPLVIKDAKKTHCDNCDYLMILGGDVIGADTPSPQLFERMRAAQKYLSTHPDVIAVPCGGCFRKNQKKSEAQIIADYLMQNGISSTRIILEDKSTTTYENFRFATKLIAKHSSKPICNTRVAFLSSSYHIHRASIIARRNGIKNVLCVSCKTPGNAVKRFIREYFVAFELLFRQ